MTHPALPWTGIANQSLYAMIPQLNILLPQPGFAGFASLLQHGILLPLDRPVAMLPLLVSLPGFTEAYIEKTVQTIFINGVAADRLDRLLFAGQTLALSAAMPGLAGAIFRRQGIHGSLRSQPQAAAIPESAAAGFLTLKLFNSIALDRVEDLLTAGILINGQAFCDFAALRAHLFQSPTQLMLADRALKSTEVLAAVVGMPVLGLRVGQPSAAPLR